MGAPERPMGRNVKPVHITNGIGDPVPVTFTGTAPGTAIESAPDTAVGPAATVPLTAPPAGTTRMTVEVTSGDASTRVRIREVGGPAGAGKLLNLLGSTVYGGDGGSIAALEAENVAGPATTIAVQFEKTS